MTGIKDDKGKLRITEWVNTYTNDLFNYAYSRLSSKELAEDIVQNVFVAACENCDRFQGQSSPKTWLFSIMRNKIADHYRKDYRDKEISSNSALFENDPIDKLFDENGKWRVENRPSDWMYDDGDLLEDQEFTNILNQCLNDLPEKWNSAIHLKYLDGEEADKICKSLGVSRQNYWQVIRRAKLMLRECLTHNWFDNK